MHLPQSPRLRRRLLWSGAAVSLVAVGVAIALLIPSNNGANPGPTGPSVPAQLAVDTKQHLAAADRRSINRLLDRFFPAAVARKNADTAWALAGPEIRASSSLAQFRSGDSPVPSYPANEPNYHQWRAIDVERNSVVLNILVHPKEPKKLGSWVFSTEVVKDHGRWLVNRIYTIAVMNPPTRPATVTHELGPADYAAPPPAPQQTTNTRSHSYLIPVAAIIGIVLLIPLSLGVVALARASRWRRAARETGRTELPPLPSNHRSH
jgi:hypothetical protein